MKSLLLLLWAVQAQALTLDGAIPASEILAGAIDTSKIATDAVTSVKIAGGAVDTNKIATDAVTNTKLLSDSVSLSKVTGGVAEIGSGDLDIVSGSPSVQTSFPTLEFIDTSGASLDMMVGANANLGFIHENQDSVGALMVFDLTNDLVGIQTSSPKTELDVEGAAQFGEGANKSTFTATGQLRVNVPAAQTIAAGNTVAADACGGIKEITAGSAVTTDTTNTFTAPAVGNKGCCMDVINTGTANNITLDANANFNAAADVVMTPCDVIRVCSNGTDWFPIDALVANTCN